MPQYPFVQVMAASGLVAILAAGGSIAVGARAGARAGRQMLRGSLIGVAVIFAGCFVWGAITGDLAAFNAQAEPGAWLQMGAFFGIMYSIAYRFAGAYIRDKAAEVDDA
jgi:hypothetical protein